jgi:hypothetical protein
MRTHLVITGLLTLVAAAPAAAKDDLVSVFKTACMGSGPFYEATRELAKARYWEFRVWVTPGAKQRLINPKDEPATWSGVSVSSQKEPSEVINKGEYRIFLDRKVYRGQQLEACWVFEDGLSVEELSSKVDAVLQLPGSGGKASPEILSYMGLKAQELLKAMAAEIAKMKMWSLRSDAWDYVIFGEDSGFTNSTYIFRVRSSGKKEL